MDGNSIVGFFEKEFKNELELSGYKLDISSDLHRKSVVFSKKSKKKHYCFRFLIEENIEVPPVVYGFWAHISFPELEKVLREILKKNKLIGEKSKTIEVLDSFQIENNLNNTLPEEGFEIKSEPNINYIIDLFSKFYKEDALPYFEYWNNITVLYDYIKGLSDDDLWDVLGQFAPMKKAVIYRLCNDESALKLIEGYYEDQKKYYEEDSEDIDNVRYYNASKELKETLEKIKPIYNIEI